MSAMPSRNSVRAFFIEAYCVDDNTVLLEKNKRGHKALGFIMYSPFILQQKRQPLKAAAD